MENYNKVDIVNYVRNGINNGTLQPRIAEKFARIIAHPGIEGEIVVSWSVDSQGNAIEEKIDTVKIDEVTNNPGWIVTKVDYQGEILVDENGHLNQWIIADSTFRKKYEIDPESPNLFKPKGGPQIFVQIPDNIILNQWGSDMQIGAGGFINITNFNDMYGISLRDFEDTYRFVEDLQKQGPKI